MTIKTIFLDRDGVINKDKNYLYEISGFEFIEGVFSACKYLATLEYKIIVITNQSGIGRGYFSENDFELINTWMIDKFKNNGVEILDVFYCPHSPNLRCDCRKPNPGMFFDAITKYNIDAASSWMIGDSERDITAANLAGIKNTILVRSGHCIDENHSKASYILDSIKDINEII